MKYLVFDIECADGGKATICSFGYVIADEQFRILKKEDIVINPQGKFFLEGRAGRPDVKLAYSQARFERAPKFPHFYERIKALLENEEYCVIGHSVSDDVAYLNKACKRYNLPALSFSYFDTQRFYREVMGERRAISLENAIKALEIDYEAKYHRSDEDAFATLLVLQKLLEQKGMTMAEYIATPNPCTGKTNEYEWAWDISPENVRTTARRSKEPRGLRDEKYENVMLKGRKNHTLFLRYLDFGEGIGEKSDKLAGKKVSVSMNYETEHFKEMVYLVGLIKAAGGEYVLKASTVDVFATFEQLEEDGSIRRCSRSEYVKEAVANGAEIEITTLDKLLSLLGTTLEELETAPALDIDYLLDTKYGKTVLAV